jgi:NadR type nicotinamide-nucleotide adenylyltransferase
MACFTEKNNRFMIKKVIITGPESTGKSTLAKRLAEHYQTLWVPEYAREYIDRLNRPYNWQDLLNIMEGQLRTEKAMEGKAKDILFYDTSLLVIKVWYEYKFGALHPLIREKLRHFTCNLFLLSDVDLPWKYDPQREHPHQRSYFFQVYKKELEHMGVDFVIISGTGETRLKHAINAIDRTIKTK